MGIETVTIGLMSLSPIIWEMSWELIDPIAHLLPRLRYHQPLSLSAAPTQVSSSVSFGVSLVATGRPGPERDQEAHRVNLEAILQGVG